MINQIEINLNRSKIYFRLKKIQEKLGMVISGTKSNVKNTNTHDKISFIFQYLL